MYRGYNLVVDNNQILEQFIDEGERLSTQYYDAVKQGLDSFLNSHGTLNGSRLREHWFPKIQADIFVSHSHKDERLAKALAGWLFQTFGLNSFIDSCVWGYADELLKEIDDKYCRNPDGERYSYEKRNGSTSHVHMLLTSALGMMIDNTECLMFLNTPNSITSSEIISKTLSPWLFMEIVMSKMIRCQIPSRISGIMEKQKSLQVEYDMDLTSLTSINHSTLMEWQRKFVRPQNPLDVLYKMGR